MANSFFKIPTGVGNVGLISSQNYKRAVHPHGRGEMIIVHGTYQLF